MTNVKSPPKTETQENSLSLPLSFFFFFIESWVVFHYAVSVQCSGCGSLPRTDSRLFQSKKLARPASQVIRVHLLCGLGIPAGFSEPAGELRASPKYQRYCRAAGECCDCLCLLALARWWGEHRKCHSPTPQSPQRVPAVHYSSPEPPSLPWFRPQQML